MKLESTEMTAYLPTIQALFGDYEAVSVRDELKSSNSVILVDRTGIILRANIPALHLFGCSEEEMLGKFYGSFFCMLDVDMESWEAQSQSGADPIFRCLFKECPCFSIAGWVRSFDGGMHAIDGSVAPLYGENREIFGAVVICRSLDA